MVSGSTLVNGIILISDWEGKRDKTSHFQYPFSLPVSLSSITNVHNLTWHTCSIEEFCSHSYHLSNQKTQCAFPLFFTLTFSVLLVFGRTLLFPLPPPCSQYSVYFHFSSLQGKYCFSQTTLISPFPIHLFFFTLTDLSHTIHLPVF